MTKASIRVMVVEDHHVVRQGLVALDGEYASATQILLGHAEEYRAKMNAALAVTRPTFNEEMRAGHTNM